MLPENFNDEKAQQQNQNNSLLEAGEPPIPKLVLGDPLKRHINVGRSAQIVKIKVFLSRNIKNLLNVYILIILSTVILIN